MQTQKNLYNVVVDAVNDDIRAAAAEAFMEQFSTNRSGGFTTKYRAIDGAIYKADDIKLALKKAEDMEAQDIRGYIEDMLLNLYAVTYGICELFNANKSDEMTVHEIPKKAVVRNIPLLDEFVPEKIVPLLEFAKAVLKDSKNSVCFDDCISIVTIFDVALENLNDAIKSGNSKKYGHCPLLGCNFFFRIESASEAKKDEAEVSEKAEEKAEEKIEEKAEEKTEEIPAPSHKFNFEAFDSIEPEKTEEMSETAETGNSAEEEKPAEEEKEEAGEKAEDVAEERVEEDIDDEDDDFDEPDDINTDKLRDYADNVAKTLKEFENSRMLFENLRESIEINIKLPGSELSGSSKSIINDIRKNINATIQNSLQPLHSKMDDDYSEAMNSVNLLNNELNNIMKYLKEIGKKFGLEA